MDGVLTANFLVQSTASSFSRAKSKFPDFDIAFRKYRGQLASDHQSNQFLTRNVGHFASLDDSTIPQDGHSVRDCRQLFQSVRDIDHTHALIAKLSDHAEQILNFLLG